MTFPSRSSGFKPNMLHVCTGGPFSSRPFRTWHRLVTGALHWSSVKRRSDHERSIRLITHVRSDAGQLMLNRRNRDRLLLLAPIMPSDGGNGLAMRAGFFLDAYSRRFEVDLVVVPVAG